MKKWWIMKLCWNVNSITYLYLVDRMNASNSCCIPKSNQIIVLTKSLVACNLQVCTCKRQIFYQKVQTTLNKVKTYLLLWVLDLAGKWILKSTKQKMWEDGNHVKLIVSCYGNFFDKQWRYIWHSKNIENREAVAMY